MGSKDTSYDIFSNIGAEGFINQLRDSRTVKP